MSRRRWATAGAGVLVAALVAVAARAFADSHIASPSPGQRFHVGDTGTSAKFADIFLSCEANDVGGGGLATVLQAPAGVFFDNSFTPGIINKNLTTGTVSTATVSDTTHVSINTNGFTAGDNYTLTNLHVLGSSLAYGASGKIALSVNAGTSYGYADTFNTVVANKPSGAMAAQNNPPLSPGATAVPANNITVSEVPTGQIPSIWAATGIMLTIPPGLGVTWHNVGTLTGPVFAKVNASPITYTDGGRTVIIPVNTDFAVNDAVVLRGLQFDVAAGAADTTFSLLIRVGGPNNSELFPPTCGSITISGVPKLTSPANQSFTVGDAITNAGTLTVTETSGLTPKMTAGSNVRIVIPSSLQMQWDASAITTGTTGTGVVGAPTVITTTNANDTLNIPVTTSFSSNNVLTINNAQFKNFSLKGSPVPLQLFVTGSVLNPQPVDNHTRAIGKPTFTSQADQDFLVSPPGPATVAMSQITIADDLAVPRLLGTNPIRIRIPAGFHMAWNLDPPGTAVLGGALAGATVAYETSAQPNDTLKLTPTGSFGAAQGTISGLNFTGFSATSPPANLHMYLSTTDPTTNFMADTFLITIGGRPTISSGFTQNFTVNDPKTAANQITIQDHPTSPSIKAGNTLQVVIPASLNFTWDSTLTTPTITGTATGKTSPSVAYSVNSKTLKITVTVDFAASDTLILNGLKFMNFAAASAPAGLQVTVTATGPVAATDTFTKGVGAPTMASAQDQVFGKLDPPTAMQAITITDDPVVPRLLAGSTITIWIPTGFNMTWGGSPVVSTTGAGAVGAPSFANANQTLVIPVTTSFIAAAGQTVKISGATFNGFSNTSPLNNLEFFINGSIPPAIPNAIDQHSIKIGTRPNVLSVKTADQNGNGSIDHLIVLFDKAMNSTSSVTTGLGFTAAGYTILGGSVTGSTVTLTLRETGLPDTGATPTLTYNPAVGDLSDTLDSLGLTSAIPLTGDAAPPVVVGISLADTNGDGHPDTITITFSENLAPGQQDVNDWKIVDADGTTNLLQGVGTGSLSISGNQLTFNLPGNIGTMGTPRYRYQSDGLNGTLQDSSGNAVVIQTNNHPPVASAGFPQTVLPTKVTLNASASTDPDGQSVTFSWVNLAPFPTGSAITPAPQTSATPSVLLTTPGIYTFQVTVSDGLDSTTAMTTVTILNAPPTAVSILDQVVLIGSAPASPVLMSGVLSSDVNGDPLTFSWAQLSGPPGGTSVALSGATTSDASFTPTIPGVYVFEVTVTDTASNTDKAQTVIRVHQNAATVVPTAVAGPNQVRLVGSPVILDGTASTSPVNNLLSYSWAPALLLTGAGTSQPTFTPPGPGLYTFQLTVTDSVSGVSSLPDAVTVMAYNPSNKPPLAVASKLSPFGNPLVGDLVTLDSAGSLDPEGAPLQFAWTQVAGPSAFLSSASAAQPTFTPVFPGSYTFQLVVSDGTQQSFGSKTTFQVLQNAGDTPLALSASLGTATQPNGHVLISAAPISLLNGPFPPLAATGASNFWWEQTIGPAVVLTDGSNLPLLPVDNSGGVFFTPPRAGRYQFRLNTINLSNNARSLSLVDVVVDASALPAGAAPTAKAGPNQAVTAGQTVTLDATGSLFNGTLNPTWVQIAGPPVVLSDPFSSNPTFVPTVAGIYIFSLTVKDAVGTTTPSTVQVAVSPASTSTGGGGGGGGGCGMGVESLLLLGAAIWARRRRSR